MKVTGRKRRGEGLKAGGRGSGVSNRKGDPKREREDRSRWVKMGDLEPEREKEMAERWGTGRDGGMERGKGESWGWGWGPRSGGQMNGVSKQEVGKWEGEKGPVGHTEGQGK